jgi:hypothetical protein
MEESRLTVPVPAPGPAPIMFEGVDQIGGGTFNMPGGHVINVLNYAPNVQPSLQSLLGPWLHAPPANPSPWLIPPSAPIPNASGEAANGHPLPPPPPPPPIPSGSHTSATHTDGESDSEVNIVCALLYHGEPGLTSNIDPFGSSPEHTYPACSQHNTGSNAP